LRIADCPPSREAPDDFGICTATADGAVFETGDRDRPFTIQSVSKPFTFGMAVEDFGADTVAKYVGVEPSGDVLNSIQLQRYSNRPHNPMINAGAITVTALLHARYGEATFDRVLARFSDAAGRELRIDEAVYESERRTGHRNGAIAHLLLNFGLMHDAAELTGAQVFEVPTVKSILSIMFHVRDVRVFRRMGVSRRRSGEERRRGRRDCDREPPARDRDLLTAARCAR
jgi:glutaminase